MKKIHKICLSILVIDVLLYRLLFHSGIILPIINPSIEEYNKHITSFPRDYGQQILWFTLHVPLVSLIAFINENFILISVVQYPLVIIGLSKLITKLKTKKNL